MTKFLAVAAALLIASGATSAQTKEPDHQAHHPDGAASAATAKAPAMASTAANDPGMASKMKAMQEMHRKMVDAKTPDERQTLMAEHMKAMRDGMGMMKQMSIDPKARMQAMEQRMDMMQMMMEMMMDRMPAGSTPTPSSK